MPQNDPIASLIALLSRLPGVGERTAARLAFHVLEGDAQYAQALGEALGTIHDQVTRCELCGNYGAEARCAICQDPRRDPTLVCVVAKVPDLIALEALGSFRGCYHVLHGLLAPLDGVGPDQLPLDGLERRIADQQVKEIIVVCKTHFDIGYTHRVDDLLRYNRTTMIDRALATMEGANSLPPEQQFVWTSPGWGCPYLARSEMPSCGTTGSGSSARRSRQKNGPRKARQN